MKYKVSTIFNCYTRQKDKIIEALKTKYNTNLVIMKGFYTQAPKGDFNLIVYDALTSGEYHIFVNSFQREF